MKYPILFLIILSLAYSQLSVARSTAHSYPHSQPNGWNEQTLPCNCKDESASQLLQLASKGISDRQAASIAKKKYGGSVVNVSRKGSTYRVKLIKDGKVRIVKVDANTGKIL